ncbi:hypothetical protein [Planobispora longispora]|uniref:Uncharacterized protein n=1 Tax=Planobispora longispora TaxID=28887 RepID=A0A8J3RGY2_9ACTN|nr:hypothetical protein [Planobispora longispora]BFE84716.1 hypothetical protein GCM10020093_073170 [Planobispora longispora]GIH75502.1 hypothetical protein Plo01_19310 [Planobispora longispora]
MVAELKFRYTGGDSLTNSPIAGIRIMAALPSNWTKDLAHSIGEVVLLVRADTDINHIHSQTITALKRPENAGWELVACRDMPRSDASKGLDS